MRILLEVKNIRKFFRTGRGFFKSKQLLRAVDDVNLSIYEGETMGLVGESGSGKTTLGRMIVRLIEPTEGEICFDGQNILELDRKEMRQLRRSIQIVFQDPQSSLDPRMTVKKIIREPLIVHRMYDKETVEKRIWELLERVGLSADHLGRFPHEFSGGQRQRICIARALVLNPRLLVLDEPTSSLDVSVQGQILNLLQDLQDEFNLTYLFISHDLSIVKHMAHRIAVMYAGEIVEVASKEKLFENPSHPYTRSLLSAIPIPDPNANGRKEPIRGDTPNPSNFPPGCRFHPRCPYAFEKCKQVRPHGMYVRPNHLVSCHLYDPALQSSNT